MGHEAHTKCASLVVVSRFSFVSCFCLICSSDVIDYCLFFVDSIEYRDIVNVIINIMMMISFSLLLLLVTELSQVVGFYF